MKKWLLLWGLLVWLATPAALALAEWDMERDMAAAQELMGEKLQEMAEAAENLWAGAMLADARIEGAKAGKTSVTFTVSWPALKSALTRNYKDGEEAAAYISAALGGDKRLTAQVNLAVVWENGEAIPQWSRNNSPEKLLKQVQTAASRAEKSYETPAFLKGLRAWCLPESAPAPKRQPAVFPEKRTAAFAFFGAGGENAEYWAAVLYTVKNVTLEMAGGPANARLTFKAAPASVLMDAALAQAQTALEQADGAPRLSREALSACLLQEVQRLCLAYRHQKALGEEAALTLDLTVPAQRPQEVVAWLAGYDKAWVAALDNLQEAAAQMPPHVPSAEPETACISGGEAGTRLNLLNQLAGGAYIKIEVEGLAVATAYVRRGEALAVALPQGAYVLKTASGPQWYGETWLFGEEGTYGWGRLQVDASAYTHTLTLRPGTEGAEGVYVLPFSDF